MIGIYDVPDGYICEGCGEEFDLDYKDETCCFCDNELIPAFRCEVCDRLTPDFDVQGYEHRVCQSCIEKKRKDLEFCKKVGEATLTECCLNSFLASFFTESEINDLLYAALKERDKVKPVDCMAFLMANAGDAADVLADETNG